MFSQYAALSRRGFHLQSSTGPTYPKWIQQMAKPAYVDVVGLVVPSANAAGKSSIRLSVLNRHPSADFKVDLKFDEFEVESVEVHEMYSADLSAAVSATPYQGILLMGRTRSMTLIESSLSRQDSARKSGRARNTWSGNIRGSS